MCSGRIIIVILKNSHFLCSMYINYMSMYSRMRLDYNNLCVRIKNVFPESNSRKQSNKLMYIYSFIASFRYVQEYLLRLDEPGLDTK